MLDVPKHVLAARRGGTKATRRMAAGWLLTLLAIASAPIASQPAYAESYPERTIKIVVPFPAGGPTDIVARLIAQSLSSRLGQNVVVENLTGAGGRIGAKAAASAQPDGYTLLLGGTNVNTMLGALYKNLGFDPNASFAPIAAICVDSMALAISPGVPGDTFLEFVHYAKSNPGKLKYGAPPGIYPHFAGEFFKIKTGTDILFVPYKGGPAAITDVLGGHIDMVFNPKSSLLTHFKAGKLKALAVTSEARWPELPDTPTMVEVGVAGFPKEIWFGLLAPAGTPAKIVGELNHAVNEGLRSEEVRAGLAKLGIEARSGTAQDFAAALADQVRDWKVVVDATGIKVE
jgi:tripartite-type tricarboxylate transporter receptor subunit TctC